MSAAELKSGVDGVQRAADAVQIAEAAQTGQAVSAPEAESELIASELIASLAILARSTAQNLPSPCISVCRMNEATGLCEGCWRTLDEIGQWGSADDPAKRLIWARIEQRLAKGSA